MSAAATRAALVGLVAGLASLSGCGGGKPLAVGGTAGNAASGSGGSAGNGVAGSGGMAGSMTAGTAGAAGQPTAGAVGNDGGTGGMAGSTDGTAGAAGQSTAGATGSGGSAEADASADGPTGAAGAIGAGLGFGGSDLTKVVPTPGCGMVAPTGLTPGMLVGPLHIMTMGTKPPNCADSKCGAWTDTRDYWVRLPTGYDMTKAYPLVFEGPGCGAKGNSLYTLAGLDSTAIRVGLSPSAFWQAFHATNPHQGCFDESDGDNSVDWVFYENLYDRLAGQLCVDRNRVFASGEYSGGGRFADELACKYAGDATRPIRGVMSNSGDWPSAPYVPPTCTTKPMAGMWVHQIGDTTRQWSRTKIAIARAMAVNGCTLGTGYDDASFDPFPIVAVNPGISTSPDTTSCRRIKGCLEISPLVVCLLPGNQHSSNSNVVEPGWPTFLKLFSAPPLLTP
jgi:hypothetical protein